MGNRVAPDVCVGGFNCYSADVPKRPRPSPRSSIVLVSSLQPRMNMKIVGARSCSNLISLFFFFLFLAARRLLATTVNLTVSEQYCGDASVTMTL